MTERLRLSTVTIHSNQSSDRFHFHVAYQTSCILVHLSESKKPKSAFLPRDARNTSVRVRLGKQLSDPLPTTSGVRQGCVLAPVLFCVAIDWILRHMKSKPGVTVGRDLFTDLVYADDTAFFVDSPTNAITYLSSFADTASVLLLGLQISWPKTKTQNLGSGPQPDTILVNGNRVDPVSDFRYLGSSQSSDGQCRPDIRRRIGLASAVMSSLDNIWKDNGYLFPLNSVFISPWSSLYCCTHPKLGLSQ